MDVSHCKHQNLWSVSSELIVNYYRSGTLLIIVENSNALEGAILQATFMKSHNGTPETPIRFNSGVYICVSEQLTLKNCLDLRLAHN